MIIYVILSLFFFFFFYIIILQRHLKDFSVFSMLAVVILDGSYAELRTVPFPTVLKFSTDNMEVNVDNMNQNVLTH